MLSNKQVIGWTSLDSAGMDACSPINAALSENLEGEGLYQRMPHVLLGICHSVLLRVVLSPAIAFMTNSNKSTISVK